MVKFDRFLFSTSEDDAGYIQFCVKNSVRERIDAQTIQEFLDGDDLGVVFHMYYGNSCLIFVYHDTKIEIEDKLEKELISMFQAFVKENE
jgi:hypothetical protein